MILSFTQRVVAGLFLFACLCMGVTGFAQGEGSTEFYKAEVLNERIVTNEDEALAFGGKEQLVTVQLKEGPEKGEVYEVRYNTLVREGDANQISRGETVLLVRFEFDGDVNYEINGRYRINQVYFWIALFILLVLIFSGKQGLLALVGLVIGVLIIFGMVIPQIMDGGSVFGTILIGTIIAAVLSLYLAHGFNKLTTLALVSTSITLVISGVLSVLMVRFLDLSGVTNEDAILLQYIDGFEGINFQGLLLGALLIGTLGVLDDITTAQTAVVAELKKANMKFSAKDLYNRSLKVGKEHIASLVNTLAFAYIGASFPTLLIIVYRSELPWWVLLNSEPIIEEIVQTLVGSAALILAVPISTYIAAVWFAKNPPTDEDLSHGHTHGHGHDHISHSHSHNKPLTNSH